MDELKVVRAIIKREGGYVNHPADKGGPTNFGITQATLATYRGRPVTAVEVESLTQSEAEQIYVSKFVKPVRSLATTQELLDLLVDSAALHGPGRVLGWAQDVGRFSTDSNVMYKGILKRRFQLIADIVVNDPTQVVFLRGWTNRLSEFIR